MAGWNCNYQSGVDGKKGNSSVPWNGDRQTGTEKGKPAGKMKAGGRKRFTSKSSGPRTRGGAGHGY